MTKPKRSKSPQRLLVERLKLANLKPRAWAVALVLKGYGRLELGTGKRITTIYHSIVASTLNMSKANVRRALKELTTGPQARSALPPAKPLDFLEAVAADQEEDRDRREQDAVHHQHHRR